MTRRKWRSRRGETLIEALISLLVASLALTMLAGMIFKSKSLLEKSYDITEAYAEKADFLNNPSSAAPAPDKPDPLATLADNLTELLNEQVKLTSDEATAVIAIDAGDSVPVPVRYVLDSTNADNPIISYAEP